MLDQGIVTILHDARGFVHCRDLVGPDIHGLGLVEPNRIVSMSPNQACLSTFLHIVNLHLHEGGSSDQWRLLKYYVVRPAMLHDVNEDTIMIAFSGKFTGGKNRKDAAYAGPLTLRSNSQCLLRISNPVAR